LTIIIKCDIITKVFCSNDKRYEMGWRGTMQVWGACGYYTEHRLSGYEEYPEGGPRCACGGEILFNNTVDDTNGESVGYIIPELFPEEPHHAARWRTVPNASTERMRWDTDPNTGDGRWVPHTHSHEEG
jgi:hypothetical protein